MELIEITITKEGKDILITNTKGGEIRITPSNNELKASETLEFLSYADNKTYKLNELDEAYAQDKNLKYVYEIFKSIIDKINPVDDNEN